MAAIRIIGRTALVALFLCTLVVVVFAQDPPAQTPTIVVNNQAVINGAITIDQTTVPQQAFLVIQRNPTGADSSLGRVALQSGTTENVVVPLAVAVAPGEQLYAAIYLDAAPVGVFEAPGADTPFLVNNQPVAQLFTITDANAPPVQATGQSTQPIQVTTQPIVPPTLTVPGPVTTPVSLPFTTTPAVQLPVSATLTATAQPTSLPTTQPTSPLPTPVPTLPPTLAPTLSPTVPPTSQPAPPLTTATPTQLPTVEFFFPQLIQPTTPTPARMPMTGATSATNLPTTLLFGTFAFLLFVGGNRICQWLGKRSR